MKKMKKKNKNKKTKKTKIMLHVDGYMSSLKTLKSMIEKKNHVAWLIATCQFFYFLFLKRKRYGS